MYKTITLATILCILICSCKKSEDSIITSGTPQQVQDSSYLISGISDVVFNLKEEQKTLLLAFSPVSSTQERITITAEGVPEKVSINFEPSSGIVPFTTTMYLNNNWGKGGNYDVKIKGTSASGKTKSLQMKLTLPDYSCTEYVVKKSGNYLITTDGNSSVIHSFNVYNYNEIAMSLSSLYLENKNGQKVISGAINAEVNCSNNEITIKETTQAIDINGTVYNYKISGNGSINYSDKKLSIIYSVITSDAKTFKYTIVSFLNI